MVPFIGFQCKLFSRLDHLGLHLFDLGSKDNFCWSSGVNTGCLDRDDDVSSVLQEVVSTILD